jgi:RNA polymerase sigma factor (sigma-70 family)
MQRIPFANILDRHGNDLLRFCHSQVGEKWGDDLFQETALAALAGYDGLRNPAAAKGWLFRIAARTAIDMFRAAGRAPVPVADLEVIDDADVRLRDPELWHKVRALPPKQRQAIGLRFIADLNHAEIGAVMETSPEAARRNVFEGLRRLRRELAPDEGVAAP